MRSIAASYCSVATRKEMSERIVSPVPLVFEVSTLPRISSASFQIERWVSTTSFAVIWIVAVRMIFVSIAGPGSGALRIVVSLDELAPLDERATALPAAAVAAGAGG